MTVRTRSRLVPPRKPPATARHTQILPLSQNYSSKPGFVTDKSHDLIAYSAEIMVYPNYLKLKTKLKLLTSLRQTLFKYNYYNKFLTLCNSNQNFSIIEFYEMTKTFQMSGFRKACPSYILDPGIRKLSIILKWVPRFRVK